MSHRVFLNRRVFLAAIAVAARLRTRMADLPAEDSLTATPEADTIYVLACEDGAGSACASATVRVETIP
jgi:hypothetical protein